ncbi:MAG: glycosyltransferase family 1 protein [Chlorobi bacterium]|nr:glycosyltransferase family 1 protein [Chlorobiota bacterium]
MKIAILGTRGIPNHHGGFEQFAEFFSVYLAKNNHDVYVYNSSSHPYQDKLYKGVNIIHCNDPEDKVGTVGQFIYDLNCILDSRKRNFDILLQLGYTSNSIWGKLLPKSSIVITNMDGLEWKRAKYSKPVQRFLKYAEKRAIKTSNYLVSDSIGIQEYLKKEHKVESNYIAYGATVFKDPQISVLKEYNLEPYAYNMLIARLEPENNIEIILDGVVLANNKTPFLVVGKHNANKFGNYLKNKFKDTNIIFTGGIYNLKHLNNLRYYSNLYFHGHSVGGTNPSLLEAMASNALLIAHNNTFNKSILTNNAFYFKNKIQVKNYIETVNKLEHQIKLENCFNTIKTEFSWELINKKYLNYFNECYCKHNQRT